MIPVLRPNPVRWAQPRRPREHGLAELDSQRLAQKAQNPPGIFLNVPRIEDGWRVAGPRAHQLKNFGLLNESALSATGELSCVRSTMPSATVSEQAVCGFGIPRPLPASTTSIRH